MKIQLSQQLLTEIEADCLVIAIDEKLANLKTHPLLSLLTQLTNNLDKKYLPQTAGQMRSFYQPAGVSAKSITLIAVKNNQKGLIQAAQKLCQYAREYHLESLALNLLQHHWASDETPLSQTEITQLLAQELANADYRFEQFKSKKTETEKLTIHLLAEEKSADLESAIHTGVSIAAGMKLTRDLGNLPGNICTPRYLAKTAQKIAKQFSSLEVDILKEKEIKALKMGALLSVSKGSIEPPRLIKLQHKGNEEDPIIFVGKGVTFDTGGISLKPGANMDEMKYDMCGAAAVMGLMYTVAELNLPINIIGIIPSVENMPSDRATKPGDIVTSMSGKTIEVLNTDAEGRMILCDALTYAQTFNPSALIDMATLTGAVIVALGSKASGVMSNNDDLANALIAAGERSGDRAWRLPIWSEYVEQLQSPFADLQNIGGREAGTITAGCFLGEFAKDVAWAHIDIAGTAWQTRENGATARPVPLLVDYLLAQLKP